MRAGDFTALAENYAKYRPDYSRSVLEALTQYVQANTSNFTVADVGAGTGLWANMLSEKGLNCLAVEPNDAMREQGIQYTKNTPIKWHEGSAENTSLDTESVDWVTMASSFHWAKQPEVFDEFNRILKPNGYLTVLWNPREIETSPLFSEIETCIYKIVPELKRESSGSKKNARDYATELTSSKHFFDVIFFEAPHQIEMSKERYIGIWRSVNDIQRQAGPERFENILAEISKIIEPYETLTVSYKTRAWTVRKV